MLKPIGLSHNKKKFGFTTETGSCIWVTELEAMQIAGAFGLVCYKQTNTEKVISCLKKPFQPLLQRLRDAAIFQPS